MDLKVTFEPSTNSGYIELNPEAGSARQYVLEGPDVRGMIVLDFDREGRLAGVEVLRADRLFPQHLLDGAERI